VLQLLVGVDNDDVELLSELPYRLIVHGRGDVPWPELGHIGGVRFDRRKQLKRVVQHGWECVPLAEVVERDLHP